MSVTDLIPRQRNRDIAVTHTPAVRAESRDPFRTLHREVNRLFDSMWNGFGLPGPYSGAPFMAGRRPGRSRRGVQHHRRASGVEEKDIEILLADGGLTLRGEKKCEQQDRRHRLSERYYGRFERRMPMPEDVDLDGIKASFRNGVLTVTLPKSTDAQRAVRRGPLQAS